MTRDHLEVFFVMINCTEPFPQILYYFYYSVKAGIERKPPILAMTPGLAEQETTDIHTVAL